MGDMVEHYMDYDSTSMHDMVELYINNSYSSMDDKMDHDIDTTIGIMQGATSVSSSCSRWRHKKSALTRDHHQEHPMEHQDPH
jgi:hypothetical protein